MCVKSTRKFPKKKYLHPILQRMCGSCSNSRKEGVITSGSIVHVDPVQFKLQTASINGKNGHQNKSKNQGKSNKDIRSSKNGTTNKGYDYDASDL